MLNATQPDEDISCVRQLLDQGKCDEIEKKTNKTNEKKHNFFNNCHL